jgi:hypothetical protein
MFDIDLEEILKFITDDLNIKINKTKRQQIIDKFVKYKLHNVVYWECEVYFKRDTQTIQGTITEEE